tara:strand:+ start:2375 stop:5380 length:3006 start_codon:yes stop_codon:yes gene_type:complete
MQYYYENIKDETKYKINCSNKNFANIENKKLFNNKEFLQYVNDKYGDDAFNGDSPFTFKDEYIKFTNENICKITDYSLKPQQKFVGQIINPATNIKNSLIFHGLGSGKTCTSLVIGEAFKKKKEGGNVTKLLYVVPATLVDQYRDEILGELKMFDDKEPEIWSCTSQCLIDGKRDFYTNTDDRLFLQNEEQIYTNKLNKLTELNILINQLSREKKIVELKKKKDEFKNLQEEVKRAALTVNNRKQKILSKVTMVFEIISHNIFINDLFKKIENGTWKKMSLLTDKNSPLLSSNGILVIDEIQRLVSASGILYKKLFNAIYQYIHPNCRIILLSATPIYDNPYELALTVNLLRPRVLFPLNKDKFYSFFLGRDDEDDDGNYVCKRVKTKNFITNNSCVINKNLLKILLSGYISYFKGGNPIAYPYKRIIIMEHRMAPIQKEQYIGALRSDISKDKDIYSKLLAEDEFLFKNEFDTDEKEDSVSGIYTTTQQYSNISLPISKSTVIENLLSKQAQSSTKLNFDKFKNELKAVENPNVENILNYIRKKGYSEKFVNIIELSYKCDGPVFIFSNWLKFGVEALSIILDACGFKKYPNGTTDDLRYFVWSSETSSDKNLTRKAQLTFNSMKNSNGSLLKIILGTRSIMEGVSFKNVKQVHITDPWWNESRIEQILARAVRFCSHSNLPLKEQYTDIFRHYSVLPMQNDQDVIDMLLSTIRRASFKDFESLTIEQKMLLSSIKKYQINNEFDEILKEVAYDCELNKKGNIIRLEENVRPLSDGNYQIYFKNPKTLQIYIRDGIPDKLNFDQILSREYSYPNDSKLPLIFYEVDQELNKEEPEVILKEPEINKDLTFYEDIKCWDSDLNLQDIFDEISDKDIISYFNRINDNFNLYPSIRKEILGEQNNGDRINFNNKRKSYEGKIKLIKCLQNLSQDTETPHNLKIKLSKLLKTKKVSIKFQEKINKIVYEYNYLPETMIEELQTLELKDINNLLSEAENFNSQKKK